MSFRRIATVVVTNSVRAKCMPFKTYTIREIRLRVLERRLRIRLASLPMFHRANMFISLIVSLSIGLLVGIPLLTCISMHTRT